MKSLVSLKLILAIGTLIISVQGFAKDKKPAPEYVAMPFQDKILATNGKHNYIVDLSGLQDKIKIGGGVLVNIYGTQIWMTVKSSGELTMHKARLKDTEYYVVAPLKEFNAPLAPEDGSYEVYGYGLPNSNAVSFPNGFCSGCATTTKIDPDKNMVIKKLYFSAKEDLDVPSRKPGSSGS